MKNKKMSSKEKEKREEIVKGMKKKNGKEFERRYPGRGKEVMYATATKRSMKEDYKSVLYSLLEGPELPKSMSPQTPQQMPGEAIGALMKPSEQRNIGLDPSLGVAQSGDYADTRDNPVMAQYHTTAFINMARDPNSPQHLIQKHIRAMVQFGVDVPAIISQHNLDPHLASRGIDPNREIAYKKSLMGQ